MESMWRSAFWLQMADEAMAVAVRLRDPELRRQMFIVAAEYEALASRAEELARTLRDVHLNERPADSGRDD